MAILKVANQSRLSNLRAVLYLAPAVFRTDSFNSDKEFSTWLIIQPNLNAAKKARIERHNQTVMDLLYSQKRKDRDAYDAGRSWDFGTKPHKQAGARPDRNRLVDNEQNMLGGTGLGERTAMSLVREDNP